MTPGECPGCGDRSVVEHQCINPACEFHQRHLCTSCTHPALQHEGEPDGCWYCGSCMVVFPRRLYV